MLKVKVEIRKDLGFGALTAEAGSEHVCLCVGALVVRLRPGDFAAIAEGFAEVQAELAKHGVPTLRDRIKAYAEAPGHTDFSTPELSVYLSSTGDSAPHEMLHEILESLGYQNARLPYSKGHVWRPVVRAGGAS